MLQYTLEYEYEKRGYAIIAGTDEAGRGCLAGPVVAAACILPRGLIIDGLNDSKKLSPARRQAFSDIIKKQAISYAISFATVDEIDEMNILNAAQLAMRRAVAGLNPQPNLILVDGNIARDFPIHAVPVIKGDLISPSIAAASILAKVYRDDLLVALDKEYPGYGFAKNKSYFTKEHVEALRRLGPSPCHRKTFLSFLYREQQ
jgi:ribonuclease HII